MFTDFEEICQYSFSLYTLYKSYRVCNFSPILVLNLSYRLGGISH